MQPEDVIRATMNEVDVFALSGIEQSGCRALVNEANHIRTAIEQFTCNCAAEKACYAGHEYPATAPQRSLFGHRASVQRAERDKVALSGVAGQAEADTVLE
jgi:hypothetical protein